MSEEKLELVHGSGNIYRDFEKSDADVRQAKALLAAEIIKILEEEGLSTREAQARTGINHSEFVKSNSPKRLRLALRKMNDEAVACFTHFQLAAQTRALGPGSSRRPCPRLSDFRRSACSTPTPTSR